MDCNSCVVMPAASLLACLMHLCCVCGCVCVPNPQAPQLLAPPQPSPAGQQHDPLGGFCEFPAINPARRGAAYRYAYCLSAARPTNMGNALSKMDLQQGTAQTWHEPGGALGGWPAPALALPWLNVQGMQACSGMYADCFWHTVAILQIPFMFVCVCQPAVLCKTVVASYRQLCKPGSTVCCAFTASTL